MRILRTAVIAILLICLAAEATAETAKVVFPAALGSDSYTAQIDFDAELFLNPSDSYNQQLARMSLCMAVAAFRTNTVTYKDSDSSIHSYFDQTGFTNYEAEQFEVTPTEDTIASAMAMRELSDGSVLVAIAVSGQGYKNEWMSNFAVGGDNMHAGFRNAENIVFQRLEAYLQKYQLTENHTVRLWMSGFSRAAAISNLLAAHILGADLTDANNVFAYTFGTPSTTKTPIAYPQIFNIVGSFDPVAFIPFSNWGYGKHGTTLYLPAAEDDIDYSEKLQTARAAYVSITGTETGFSSNVNANWLLSKLMELLYRIMPESTFYSEEFQQTLIDTWAEQGSIWEKISFLIKQVIGNNSLVDAIQSGSVGVGTLIAESLYNAYMEIAGKTKGKWADLFTGAAQLIHEHEPSIYLSWLMSTDDPDQLFNHPTTYTRLIVSDNFTLTVEKADGTPVTNSTFARFTLNGQIYYAIPDGDYTARLTCRKKGDGIAALRYHDVRSISEVLYKTEPEHYSTGDELVIKIGSGGVYEASRGEKEVPLLNQSENGLAPIAGELTLSGSNGIRELVSLAASFFAILLPHMMAVLIILLYCLSMFIYKLTMHSRNEIIETNRYGRMLLVLVTAACTVSVGRHLFACVLELISRMPELENRTAIRAASLLGTGTVIYELTDAVMYALLAALAWRGRAHHRSRIRGRRLAGMFTVIKLLTLLGAQLCGDATYYDYFCVFFFLGCFIAFIVVRNVRYEKEMNYRQFLERQQKKDEKRLARKAAKT